MSKLKPIVVSWESFRRIFNGLMEFKKELERAGIEIKIEVKPACLELQLELKEKKEE